MEECFRLGISQDATNYRSTGHRTGQSTKHRKNTAYTRSLGDHCYVVTKNRTVTNVRLEQNTHTSTRSWDRCDRSQLTTDITSITKRASGPQGCQGQTWLYQLKIDGSRLSRHLMFRGKINDGDEMELLWMTFLQKNRSAGTIEDSQQHDTVLAFKRCVFI